MKKLSLILLAILAFGQVAWAQLVSNESELRSAVMVDNATVTLGDDITLSNSGDKYLKISDVTVTIDLNGHTLKRSGLTSADANGHVIEVFASGNLTLTSSQPDGTLTGGWANNGGGICNNGTVTIENNITITGCKANEGGGIKNNAGATLNMNGGSVTGNAVSSCGGGVWSDGILNMQGAVTVSDNTIDNNVEQNVFLKTGKVITVTGTFANDANIGVSLQAIDGTFTSGYSNFNSGTDPDTYFFADLSPQTLALSGGEATLSFPTGEVYYIDREWDDVNKVVTATPISVSNYTLVTSSTTTLAHNTWYVVRGNVTLGGESVMTMNGTAHLILCDGAQLKCKSIKMNDYDGSPNRKILHVYGQTFDSGKLRVNEQEDSYAIECLGGDLYFHGGDIYANSSDATTNAGIGGTQTNSNYSFNMFVYGGKIYAQGGAAGIGGGLDNDGGVITIYGGRVEAHGGYKSPGIGGGLAYGDASSYGVLGTGSGRTLTIWGGEVYAYGGKYAPGIGCGYSSAPTPPHGGIIQIHGGYVYAKGGSYGAGIGGSQDGNGGHVTVTGGRVYAIGGTDAAGIGCGERDNGSTNMNGGTLIVTGGYVFADGTDWGAGIGGGEDSKGAVVEITGGIVEAWAGADAGNKNGCAIGSEDGDGRRGSLTIGDAMMVHAGQNPTDANAHLFPSATRVPACFFRPFARIEPCDHQGATYTIDGTDVDGTHTLHCTHCLTSDTLTHTFDDHNTCTVCGVNGSVSTVSVYLPVYDSGTNTYSYSSSPRWTEQLVTGSRFELPAPQASHLPAGVRFVGWREGSPSDLGLTDPHVNDGEELLAAGTSYTVTGDVSLTPRYKTFHVFTTAGDWNEPSNWCWNTVPTPDKEILIAAAANIPSGYIAQTGNSLTLDLEGTITIADGGQFIHSTEGVTATVEKHITGYNRGDGGYYLLTNPVMDDQNPETTGMLDNDYDLYLFNQSQELEWQNYKKNSFNLENGKGYLYANSANTDIAFTGVLNRSDADISVPVTCDANANFAGWNLVGNPFVCNAYLADGRDFYVLDEAGEEVTTASGAIAPMQGVFVQATADENNVSFTTTAPAKGNALNLSVTRGATVIDNARIRFGEGRGLEKFQLNPNHSKIYIPQDGKDYAVVNAEPVGEMRVSFSAKENGSYTLSFSSEEVAFNYLHLIDNMTGNDVDMLATPSYTFEAKTTDYANRFKLVFAMKDGPSTSSGTFAYISDGNIIINGEGVLQVVDVMGRIIVSSDVARNVSTSEMTPGMYVLRLINGENVKSQKIVIK